MVLAWGVDSARVKSLLRRVHSYQFRYPMAAKLLWESDDPSVWEYALGRYNDALDAVMAAVSKCFTLQRMRQLIVWPS